MKKVKKRVCVIGLGLFGINLSKALSNDAEVLAIDQDERLVNQVIDHVQRALIMDATDYDSLASVVDSDFDEAVIGISEHLEASILCTLHLKKIGVKKVWAKAVNDDHMTVLKAIGADEIIFPEKDSAERLAMHIQHENLIDYIPVTEEYNIMEVEPPEWFLGKTLLELALRNRFDVFVMAVKQKTDVPFHFLPGSNFVIKPDDILVMVGKEENLDQIKDSKEPPA